MVRWIKIYSYYARKNSNNIFSENNTAETNVEFKRLEFIMEAHNGLSARIVQEAGTFNVH